MKARDLTGQVFGRLTAIKFSGRTRTAGGESKRNWLCQCTCGNELNVAVGALTSGNTTSCGCYKLEVTTKHGMWQSRVYQTWSDMKTRCINAEHKSYEHYGGRGISYQESWETFEGFWLDMEEGYADNLTLERVDVNGNYCKENCTWVTKQTQARNRRKHPQNKTGVTGVRIWVDKKVDTPYYVASSQGFDGKVIQKMFSVLKYGEEEAFRLACKFREDTITKLNEMGAGYAESHGK
ncbi:MAG: AP2 domain-containing protein [Chitinophagaceae bacterium]|nr:MAG: AP2 domain-containing protein [Chitinophagaceae bacterium]